MVYNFENKEVNSTFNNVTEFIALAERAKELSSKFDGAEEIQELIDSSTFELCGKRLKVTIDIVSIFFGLEDLLRMPIITSHTLEFYGLINLMFKGLEFDEGFYIDLCE